MLIITVKWLICSRQNARLTAGTVKTLKVAHAVCPMDAIKATGITLTTEFASVTVMITSRFDIWFFCCYAGKPTIMICCCFFSTFSLSLLFHLSQGVTKKIILVTTVNGDQGL